MNMKGAVWDPADRSGEAKDPKHPWKMTFGVTGLPSSFRQKVFM